MSYKRISPSPVIEGGTGAQTLTGVLTGNGTSAVTANTVTNHNVLVGAASNGITSVSPSATSGIPLVSGGSSADPSFTTAVVAGGGTGVVTMTTAYAPVCAGTTATGALQVASTGLGTSGNVLTSTGASSLPTFQALPAGGVTITGDSGSASGSTITLTGSTSGAVFTGSGSTVTESFNFLALPGTTSTTGYIRIGSFISFWSPVNASNMLVGALAGNATMSGGGNNGLGQNALSQLTSGGNNVAVGYLAGNNFTSTESNNICINATGGSSDQNTLRIGVGTGSGAQQLNKAFVSGINGITVTGTAVLVSAGDQLGVAVSSRRFKENIKDMGDVSSSILKLRPVTFNYIVGDDNSQQAGLIAEEVEEVMPSLVVYDKEGLPQTVKYHDLPALLLNELQKALKRIEVLEQKLSDK